MEEVSFYQLLIVSAIAFLTPIVASRVPGRVLPAVVLEIVAGIIFGPSVLHVLEPDQILDFLAEFGFAYLMFLSGLEVDARVLLAAGDRNHGHLRQFVTSPIGASLTVFAGTVLVAFFGVVLLNLAGIAPDYWLTALILSTTSVGLVLPTLKERGLSTGAYGQTLMACAFAADFITLMLIGIFAAAKRDGLSLDLALVLVLPLAFLLAWQVGNRLNHSRIVARTMEELAHATSQLQVRGSLALMLTFVVLAETTGTELILGSFIAGAIVSLFSPAEGASIRFKLDAIGYGLFIPIFFISVGIDLDFGALGDSTSDLVLLPAFLIIAYAAKLIPALVLRLQFGARETLAAGFLLSSRLSLIIAASLIGLELGIVTPSVNTVIVLVAIVTATLSPMGFSLLTPLRRGGIPFVVLAGAGTMGRALAKQLEAGGAQVSFIDRDGALAGELGGQGFRVIAGDGFDVDTLRRAGIEQATTFVAVTNDDDANLAACEVVRREFAVPNLVARLNQPDYAEAFHAAGVRVVGVAQATSASLVNAVLRPNLFEMMVEEPQGYDILEVRMVNEALDGHFLKDIRLPGNALVMLVRRDGAIIVPKGQTKLERGDTLTVAGAEESVREAAVLLGSIQ